MSLTAKGVLDAIEAAYASINLEANYCLNLSQRLEKLTGVDKEKKRQFSNQLDTQKKLYTTYSSLLVTCITKVHEMSSIGGFLRIAELEGKINENEKNKGNVVADTWADIYRTELENAKNLEKLPEIQAQFENILKSCQMILRNAATARSLIDNIASTLVVNKNSQKVFLDLRSQLQKNREKLKEIEKMNISEQMKLLPALIAEFNLVRGKFIDIIKLPMEFKQDSETAHEIAVQTEAKDSADTTSAHSYSPENQVERTEVEEESYKVLKQNKSF